MAIQDNTLPPNSRQIPLTKGKFSIVDEADYEWLSKKKWCAHHCRGRFVAVHNYRKGGKMIHVQMHRLIMQPSAGMQIDHINGDTLDNRRCNLRICTNAENCRNRKYKESVHGYKGVAPVRNGRWGARICINYRQSWLGSYDTIEEAARAYNEAAIRIHGNYALLNNV